MRRIGWVALATGNGLLIALPFALYGLLLLSDPAKLGFDLHVFWEAARAVGRGDSPYNPAQLAHLRIVESHNMSAEPDAPWAVYPPALFTLLVPFGLLPWPVAAVLGITLLGGAPALALWIMGVRDWRCYALAYLSFPILSSVGLGTLSTALMVGYALVWRGSHSVWAGAATTVAKLLLWPLVIVVCALEGIRRAVLLSAVALTAVVASWAVIGFADIGRYPQLLTDLSGIEAHNSFSLTGLAYALGLPLELGTVASLALGSAVCALAFRAGLQRRRDAAYTLGLVAALLVSPIVWLHYLALLFLPIAARYPRFHWLWLAPLILWVHGAQSAGGELFPFAVFWACLAAVMWVTLRPATRLSEEGARERRRLAVAH
jgi:hypothetical protein